MARRMRTIGSDQYSSEIHSPERRLWNAVILNAFRDACRSLPPQRKRKHTEATTVILDARDWLTSNSINFQMVCYYADVPPHKVQALAQTFADRDWPAEAFREAFHRADDN